MFLAVTNAVTIETKPLQLLIAVSTIKYLKRSRKADFKIHAQNNCIGPTAAKWKQKLFSEGLDTYASLHALF